MTNTEIIRKKNKFKLKHYINYIIVGAAFLVFYILYEAGMLNRVYINGLTQICYTIILAVSLNLVVGFLGELSLGHAGFMCLGAYIGGLVYKILISSAGNLRALIIGMLVGGIVAAVFGFLIGLPALRLKGDYLAIVTLAFGEIVRSVIKNQVVFGGAGGMSVKRYGNTLFIVSFITLFISLILIQNFIRSKHGRAVMAIRDSEIAARAMGVNATYYKLLVFSFSSMFAGIAGVLYTLNTGTASYSAFDYNKSIEILVIVVLGGMGSITGSIVAATFITVVSIQLQALGGNFAAVKNLIYALILIVVMILNSAPALKPIKEKLNFHTLGGWIKDNLSVLFKKMFKVKTVDSGEISDSPEGVSWGVIPTKIKNEEIILSVDLDGKEETPQIGPDAGEEQK